MGSDETPRAVRDALRALGIRNLVVGIHDPAFPGISGDDVGRGSPYARGADAWFRCVRGLGFTGVQLGPQGLTSLNNPSPYDGTVFSRNVQSIDLRDLTQDNPNGPLLRPLTLAKLAAGLPADRAGDRVSYGYAFTAQRKALAEAYARFSKSRPADLLDRLREFEKTHAHWLEKDAVYDVLTEIHEGRGFRDWWSGSEPHPDRNLWDPAAGQAAQQRKAELVQRHRGQIESYAFAQMLFHEQHARLRSRCRDLGMELLGDLQIGLSERDVFSHPSVLLRDYVMGAPPSRTNPEGQPWNYALLDPDQTDAHSEDRGGALQLLLARADKMFDEYDGIRIDHPHGLVCPWVYRSNQINPLLAVQRGARLHSSPDLPDHPELARYANVGPTQIRRSVSRQADDWVENLLPEQVDRYAVLFDALVDSAHRHGRETRSLVCEILSTLPRPLKAVLDRHGLGRFRVVQKADLADASDVYRFENAQPEDWIMVGNHDTLPIWEVVRTWERSGQIGRWAVYLAARLNLGAQTLADSPGLLVHAVFAAMFASKAENIYIFFTDLFGLDRPYNVPGTISDENWSLRLRPDFHLDYGTRLARDGALNLPKALAMALGGRGPEFRHAHSDLIAELERLAVTPSSAIRGV
jgi:4-alpha-glucanotransferase